MILTLILIVLFLVIGIYVIFKKLNSKLNVSGRNTW